MPARFSALLHLVRAHILAIACLAALTFGWLMTGRYLWAAALFCAIDWCVVNLVNRVVDLAEDRVNGIPGTDVVAARGVWLERGCWLLLVGSLAVGHVFWPALTPWRVAFGAIGLAYNYRLLPGWLRRFRPAAVLGSPAWTRFKELYFWKNFSSGVLFLLSTLAYPAVVGGVQPSIAWLAVVIGFFLPLEITYEIIYDLRDVPGDTQEGVPTFPVVHGEAVSHGIIWVLLALSAASLVAGATAGVIGLAAFVLVGGTIQQAIYFGARIQKGATAARCTFLTWLGAAQIAAYHAWIALGLPTTWPL